MKRDMFWPTVMVIVACIWLYMEFVQPGIPQREFDMSVYMQ